MGCLKLTYRSNLPTLKVVKGFSFSSEESCAGLYRYAFNGMEQDNEVSGNGNSYTTQFRQYDPRLGRWKSLDPLMSMFPWMSPYVAFDNNPVYFTDPYGLASEGGPEKGETYVDKNGKTQTTTHAGGDARPKTAYEPTVREALDISDHVYSINEAAVVAGKSEVGNTGWILQKKYIDEKSGYKAGLYRKKTGDQYSYVLASAGTDNAPDIIADIDQGAGLYNAQYEKSQRDAKRITSYMQTLKYGNNLTFVGHSLGGGLASLNSRVTGNKAITFNAAGLSSKTKDRYGASKLSKIEAYVIIGEAVHHHQSAFGLKAEGNIHWLSPIVPYPKFSEYDIGSSVATQIDAYSEWRNDLFMERVDNHMLHSLKNLIK